MTAPPPPPPGWYPDPGGAAPLRWWDGQAWTSATSAGMPTAPVATTMPQAAFGIPQQPQVGQPFAAVPAQPQGQPPGYQPMGYQPVPTPTSRHTNGTIWQENRNATYALIVTAIYVVIAVTTPFGLIGIVPILASVRSAQAGEKLAPFAIGAAVLAFIVGMLKFTHHL
jgi:hypothetical protein